MRPIRFRNRKRRAGSAVKGRMTGRYNPFGKINNPYEDFAYSLSLDSTDIISIGDGASFTRVDGPFSPAELRTFFGPEFGFLNRAERKEIYTWAGYVLYERSDGHIHVYSYEHKESLDKYWAGLEEEYYPDDEGQGD
jgi:hypothetical protein